MNINDNRILKMFKNILNTYETRVENKIRSRYSVSDEIAILRQRDTKPEEFAVYSAFAESCKAAARAEIEAEQDENTDNSAAE